MIEPKPVPLVTTIRERCRVCYTCVRECPAKAIRIYNGQADVLPDRCIGCGNCMRVCSQQAKKAISSIEPVISLLSVRGPIAAILAPSFPSEFHDIGPELLVGMIRKLGFTLVSEVAFGADLVARATRDLLDRNPTASYIASSCPAAVSFIEKYHPSLVPMITPLVSPMVATARVLQSVYGDDLPIIFIGPCIAKKGEIQRPGVAGDVVEAITFRELRQIFAALHVTPQDALPSAFDPPHPGPGTLFPLKQGLLTAAGIQGDLWQTDFMAAEGRHEMLEVIKEMEAGKLRPRLLEVLSCNGCVMGAGMTADSPLFARRTRISDYASRRWEEQNREAWRTDMERFRSVDLSAPFRPDERGGTEPDPDAIHATLFRMGKFTQDDELNCGACGYDTCRDHAVAVARGLAESEMCLPFTIDKLRNTVNELAVSHQKLESAQEALMHSEKLASMGQLAAGIAHEVNNPLGVVLMYTHLLLDEHGSDEALKADLRMIAEQADRCKKIVAGLLDFARQNKVTLQPVDLRDLVETSLSSVPRPEGIESVFLCETDDPMVEVDRDQVIQILTNLINNSYAAMGETGRLTVTAGGDDQRFILKVADTGTGISKENRSKIFTPFFTTKQLGKGTGLGLPVVYGIVKMHRGDIRVESNADPNEGPTGTTFTVTLPRHGHRE